MKDFSHFHLKLKGKKFFFRPLLPSDKIFIKRGYQLLSRKSKLLRFFGLQSELSEQQLKFFSEVDGNDHVGWGVMDVSDFGANPAGTARCIRMEEEPGVAEVAITIVDAYQNMGLGNIMMAVLNRVGANIGLEKLRYHIHYDNSSMLSMLKELGKKIPSPDPSLITIDTPVLSKVLDIPISLQTKRFIEAMSLVEAKLNY